MAAIYLASDHGGFTAKQMLENFLTNRGEQVTDLGPHRLDPDDDYPIFARAVAQAVRQASGALGILLCRSGAGMAIVANKFPGIRAAVAWSPEIAHAARADDAVNVLCLAADYLSDAELREIVIAFLQTVPKTDERYQRRLREIRTIEEGIHGKDYYHSSNSDR